MSTFVTRLQDYHVRLVNHIQNTAEATCKVLLQPQKYGAPAWIG